MSTDSEGPKSPSDNQSLDLSSSPDAATTPSPSIFSPAIANLASSEDSPQTPFTPNIPRPSIEDTQDSNPFKYPLPSPQTIPPVASIGNDSTLRGVWDFYKMHQTIENSLDEDLEDAPTTPEHFDQSTVLHTFFIIKTVSTIACDTCDGLGKGEEVYKCTQCVKQICRQCANDLKKVGQPDEQDNEASKRTWAGDYRHEGFKQCFLAREAAQSKGNFQVDVPLGLLGVPSSDVVTVYMVHDNNNNGNDDAPKNKRPRHDPDSDSDDSPDPTPSKPPAKQVRRNTRSAPTKASRGTTTRDTNERTRDGLSAEATKKLDRITQAAAAASQQQPRSSSSRRLCVQETSNQTGVVPTRSNPAIPRQTAQTQQPPRIQPPQAQQPRQLSQLHPQTSAQGPSALIHPGHHHQAPPTQRPGHAPRVPFEQRGGFFPPAYEHGRQLEYATCAQPPPPTTQVPFPQVMNHQPPTQGVPSSTYNLQHGFQFNGMQQYAPVQQSVHAQRHAQSQQAAFGRQPDLAQQPIQAQSGRRGSTRVDVLNQHQAQPAFSAPSALQYPFTMSPVTQSSTQLQPARRLSHSQQRRRDLRFSPPPGTVLTIPDGFGNTTHWTWEQYQQYRESLAGPSPPNVADLAPTAVQLTSRIVFPSDIITIPAPAGHGSSQHLALAPQQNPSNGRSRPAAQAPPQKSTGFGPNQAGADAPGNVPAPTRHSHAVRLRGHHIDLLPRSSDVQFDGMLVRPGLAATLTGTQLYTIGLNAANGFWRQNRERIRTNQPSQVAADVGGRRGSRDDNDDDNMPGGSQPPSNEDGNGDQGAQQPPSKEDGNGDQGSQQPREKQNDNKGEPSADTNNDQPMQDADDQPAADDGVQQDETEAAPFSSTVEVAEPSRPSSAPSPSIFPPMIRPEDIEQPARGQSAPVHINDVWKRMAKEFNEGKLDIADDKDVNDAGADNPNPESEISPTLWEAIVNHARHRRHAPRAQDEIQQVRRDDKVRARLRIALTQSPDAVALGYDSDAWFNRHRGNLKAALRRATAVAPTQAVVDDADDKMDVDGPSSETLAAAPYDDEDDKDFPPPRVRRSKRKGKYASKHGRKGKKTAAVKTKREDTHANDQEEAGNDVAAAAAPNEPEAEEEADDVDMKDADDGDDGAGAGAATGTSQVDRRTRSGRGYGI